MSYICGNLAAWIITGIVILLHNNNYIDGIKSAFIAFGLWLPISIVYGAFFYFTLVFLKINNLFGMMELCGFCVGLFPLFFDLWPPYMWRLDLALHFCLIQFAVLLLVIFIRWCCFKIIHK